MNPNLQRRIQRYGWDKAAHYYEDGWQDQLWPVQESLLAEADPQPGENILDVSCGTGLVTIPMAKLVSPRGNVTGVDISDLMIEKAGTEQKRQLIENITFKRLDAEALDFDNNTFDIAICSLGMMYFSDPQKALNEMLRVLKPGGRAVALVWGARKNCGWAEIFPIVDKRVKSEVCPLFFQLGTGNGLQLAFEKAGFERLKSQRLSMNLHFTDDEQACLAAFLGGAVALAYQKFDETKRREADKEYLRSITPYRNDTGYDIPGEFVIVKGTKP